MFHVGLPWLLPGTELRPVSLNKRQQTRKHFSRNIHGLRRFPQCFPVSHMVNIVSSVSFCFQVANYAYATRQGILTKIWASEHSSNFCEQTEQRPNFATTFKSDGTIRYPSMKSSSYTSNHLNWRRSSKRKMTVQTFLVAVVVAKCGSTNTQCILVDWKLGSFTAQSIAVH